MSAYTQRKIRGLREIFEIETSELKENIERLNDKLDDIIERRQRRFLK